MVGITSKDVRYAMVKVPEIGAVFWIAKLFTTAFGEALSDFSNETLGAGFAVPIALLLLIGALWLQLRADRYRPWTYWTVVAMVAVFGTMAADGFHIATGTSYYVSFTVYSIILAGIFVAWYRSEGTLSIHSIDTRRRESFYWLTVLGTFAVGTAAGDMTATAMNIGYGDSVLLFACVLVIPVVLYLATPVNRIAIFWFAYVFTRPLGASFADWFGKPHNITGLNFGDGHTALVFLAGIIVCVGYLANSWRLNSAATAPAPATATSSPALQPD